MEKTLLDSEPAVNIRNNKQNHRDLAVLWEAKGFRLATFTLGADKDNKIKNSSKAEETVRPTDPLGGQEWFGVWAGDGDFAIIDVDRHGSDRAFEVLIPELETLLKMPSGEFEKYAYCITPGKGYHVLLKFPSGMLGGKNTITRS